MAVTQKASALQSLVNQLPVANKQIAAGQQAARQMQVQQAVQKAAPTTQIAPTAQATGAAVASTAGQQMIDTAGRTAQTQQQAGQLQLGEQQQAAQQQTQGLQAGIREQQMDQLSRFADVSEQAKQELFDKQMTFRRDESGRTLFNQRQLADYAILNARNEEQLRNYSQSMQLASQRKIQMMEMAYKKMVQDLEQKSAMEKGQLDFESQQRMQQAINDMNNRIATSKRAAEAEKAKWGAIFGAFGKAGKVVSMGG